MLCQMNLSTIPLFGKYPHTAPSTPCSLILSPLTNQNGVRRYLRATFNTNRRGNGNTSGQEGDSTSSNTSGQEGDSTSSITTPFDFGLSARSRGLAGSAETCANICSSGGAELGDECLCGTCGYDDALNSDVPFVNALNSGVPCTPGVNGDCPLTCQPQPITSTIALAPISLTLKCTPNTLLNCTALINQQVDVTFLKEQTPCVQKVNPEDTLLIPASMESHTKYTCWAMESSYQYLYT